MTVRVRVQARPESEGPRPSNGRGRGLRGGPNGDGKKSAENVIRDKQLVRLVRAAFGGSFEARGRARQRARECFRPGA